MARGLIGRPVPTVDAPAKVAGEALYVADLKLPQMLHGKVLRSHHPHARIAHVDAERARRVAGVRAVFTGRDVPRTPWGAFVKDQHLLAVDKVRRRRFNRRRPGFMRPGTRRGRSTSVW